MKKSTPCLPRLTYGTVKKRYRDFPILVMIPLSQQERRRKPVVAFLASGTSNITFPHLPSLDENVFASFSFRAIFTSFMRIISVTMTFFSRRHSRQTDKGIIIIL